MKLAELYRAARRNLWRIHYRATHAEWTGTPNYTKHAQARWKHTADAHRVLAGFLASMRGKLVTVSQINEVLANHWRQFQPRTRCVSRILRELELKTQSSRLKFA